MVDLGTVGTYKAELVSSSVFTGVVYQASMLSGRFEGGEEIPAVSDDQVRDCM